MFFDKYHSCCCCYLKDVRRKCHILNMFVATNWEGWVFCCLLSFQRWLQEPRSDVKYMVVWVHETLASLSFWNFSAPTAIVTNQNQRCIVLLSKTCSYQRQMISKVPLLQQHCKQCFSFALSRFETRAICKLISWFFFFLFYSLLLFPRSLYSSMACVSFYFLYVCMWWKCNQNKFFFNATTNKPHRRRSCRHRRLNAKENNFIL